MNPQRHLLAWKHVARRIDYQNWFTGACWVRLSSRPKEKKKGRLQKNKICDKSRVRQHHPRYCSAMWICVCDHARDTVIYSEFHLNLSWSFGSTGGRSLVIIYITLAVGLYSSLYYCTCCNNLLFRNF